MIHTLDELIHFTVALCEESPYLTEYVLMQRPGCSAEEIACAKRRFEQEDLSMIGLRFYGDPFIADARFDTYKNTFGDRFEAIEIDPKDGLRVQGAPPHSVLTVNLRDDDPEGPTKRAERRVIEFFKQRVGAV